MKSQWSVNLHWAFLLYLRYLFFFVYIMVQHSFKPPDPVVIFVLFCFFLADGNKDVERKDCMTGLPSPAQPGILPLGNCNPRESHSGSIPLPKVPSKHAYGLLAVLEVSALMSCPPMNSWTWVLGLLLSSRIPWWRESLTLGLPLASGGMFWSLLSAHPSQLQAPLLQHNLSGLSHLAPLFSIPSGHADRWFPLCWWPSSRVSRSPLCPAGPVSLQRWKECWTPSLSEEKPLPLLLPTLPHPLPLCPVVWSADL